MKKDNKILIIFLIFQFYIICFVAYEIISYKNNSSIDNNYNFIRKFIESSPGDIKDDKKELIQSKCISKLDNLLNKNYVYLEYGDGTKKGDIISIGDENFYIIGCVGSTLKLFARYNLYVGGYVRDGKYYLYSVDDATGRQDKLMLGKTDNDSKSYDGVIAFSDHSPRYETSEVKKYVDQYGKYIEEVYDIKNEPDLITINELTENVLYKYSFNKEIGITNKLDNSFFYSTSYWTKSINGSGTLFNVYASAGYIFNDFFSVRDVYGIRPLIKIDLDRM